MRSRAWQRSWLTALLVSLLLTPWARAEDRPGGDQPFVVAGYLPWYRVEKWSPAEVGPVTDLIFFGLKLDAEGRLNADALTPEVLDCLNAARESAGCRLLLCIGGGERSEGFTVATTSDARRSDLCESLADLCRTHSIDGVDFDWEYPEGEAELDAFARLIVEMNRGLGDEGIVSVAQSPWRDFGEAVYGAVDRVHVMSYNHRHPHARIEDCQRDIERMIEFGCPPEKLVLGVPFYGRNASGRTKTYAELAGFGGLDSGADMLLGYAFNGRDTVREKTRYVLREDLGGIMIWELGQDSSDPGTSLLRQIELELESAEEH